MGRHQLSRVRRLVPVLQGAWVGALLAHDAAFRGEIYTIPWLTAAFAGMAVMAAWAEGNVRVWTALDIAPRPQMRRVVAYSTTPVLAIILLQARILSGNFPPAYAVGVGVLAACQWCVCLWVLWARRDSWQIRLAGAAWVSVGVAGLGVVTGMAHFHAGRPWSEWALWAGGILAVVWAPLEAGYRIRGYAPRIRSWVMGAVPPVGGVVAAASLLPPAPVNFDVVGLDGTRPDIRVTGHANLSQLRVTINRESRAALLLPANHSVNRPAVIPHYGRVTVGFGVLRDPAAYAPYRAGVFFQPHGESSPLHLGGVTLPRTHDHWVDGTFDLGALAGMRGAVGVQISTMDARDDDNPYPYVAVSPPRIWSAADPRPNILVLLVDTLRPDHLNMYGYEPPTSPRLLAESRRPGTVAFTRALSTTSWTTPAVYSLMTSLMPSQLGMFEGQTLHLRTLAPPAAEQFQNAGYATVAWSANPIASSTFGLDRGFRSFTDIHASFPAIHHTRLMADAVTDFLTDVARDGTRPFFAYAHFLDPHDPYLAPPPYTRGPDKTGSRWEYALAAPLLLRHAATYHSGRPVPAAPVLTDAQVQSLRARYDGEIRFIDDALGDILDTLERRGLRDTTLVVVLSDHGEEFQEHGDLRHGRSLYAETTRIPLLMHIPPRLWKGGRPPPARIHVPVSILDVAPTLLAFAGLQEAEHAEGVNLRSLIDGAANDTYHGRRLPSVLSGPSREEPRSRAWRSAQWAFVRKRAPDALAQNARGELYDLSQDAGELVNVIDTHPTQAAELEREMDAYFDRLPSYVDPAVSAAMSDEQKAALRALGYAH